MQVDDKLGTGSTTFHNRTLRIEGVFDSKPQEAPPLSFVGVRISPFPPSSFLLHQPTYASHLRVVEKDATFESFRSLRDQLTWLDQTRPDLLSISSIASQVTVTTFSKRHIKLLNDAV